MAENKRNYTPGKVAKIARAYARLGVERHKLHMAGGTRESEIAAESVLKQIGRYNLEVPANVRTYLGDTRNLEKHCKSILGTQ